MLQSSNKSCCIVLVNRFVCTCIHHIKLHLLMCTVLQSCGHMAKFLSQVGCGSGLLKLFSKKCVNSVCHFIYMSISLSGKSSLYIK